MKIIFIFFNIYLLLKKFGKRKTVLSGKFWLFSKKIFFYFVLHFLKVEEIQKYNFVC